ncbi:MAG: ATP-binding cassette domain-containing protein, partial [Acidimicrobiales bacterium]
MPTSGDQGTSRAVLEKGRALEASGGERCKAYLTADSVTSGYNKVPIIHDISVQAGLGEIVLVMGPNGAGKSTLVKTITGKLPLLGGGLLLAGQDISGLKEEARAAKGIGYVPQIGDVFPTLTVTENLEMGGYRMPQKTARARVEEIFE